MDNQNANPPRVSHPPQFRRLSRQHHDGSQRADALQNTRGRPSDPGTLIPAGPHATRTHAVRVLSGAPIPSAFAAAAGSVQRVPAGASVVVAARALKGLGARVERRALELELGERVARELRRAVTACHVLSARGALQVGSVLALLLRVEMYGPKEPANGSEHDQHAAEEPFSTMRGRAVYFQRYRGGANWGLCIRGEGVTNFLVRAVYIAGRGELGMTKFARFAAKKLGVRKLVHKYPPRRAAARRLHIAAILPSPGPSRPPSSRGQTLRVHLAASQVMLSPGGAFHHTGTQCV